MFAACPEFMIVTSLAWKTIGLVGNVFSIQYTVITLEVRSTHKVLIASAFQLVNAAAADDAM